MKHRIILIVCLYLSVSVVCSAQTDDVLAYNNTWYVHYNDNGENKHIAMQVHPDWQKDPFVFDDHEYVTVFLSDNYDFTEYFHNPNAFGTLYYRKEDGVIYRYDSERHSDVKMFDFNLTIGSIVEDGDGRKMSVLSIVTPDEIGAITYRTDELRIFHLQYVDNPEEDDYWIDGYGSVKYGLLRPSDISGDNSESHVVFFKGALPPNITYVLNYNSYHAIPFEKIPTDIEKEEITDDGWWKGGLRLCEFIEDTLHIQGWHVMHPNPNDIIECDIEDNVITVSFVNVNSIGPQASNECMCDFDVKIPGFKPGKYTIHSYEAKDVTTVCWPKGWKNQCDINKDGKVDITDVVGVINTIAGDTRYKDSADVNSDGRTDITDVVDIINVIAGQ